MSQYRLDIMAVVGIRRLTQAPRLDARAVYTVDVSPSPSRSTRRRAAAQHLVLRQQADTLIPSVWAPAIVAAQQDSVSRAPLDRQTTD